MSVATAPEPGMEDLDPQVDPYRCPDCLRLGDSCGWHRRLAVAVDIAHLLTELDVTP